MVDDTHDSRDEERGEDEGEGEEKQPFRGTFLLAPRFKKVACEEEERSRLACHLPASHAEGSRARCRNSDLRLRELAVDLPPSSQ